MGKIDFSIIIVAYHSASDLRSLIASLDTATATRSWHATIVNNAVDEPLAPLLDEDPRVTIVEAGANLGYSGGINRAMESAPAARWVVFLNPDLTVRPGALDSLADAVRDERVAAAVPRIVDDAGSRQDSLRREPSLGRALGEALFGDSWPSRPAWLSETVRGDRGYEQGRDVDWATGAALAIRSDVADSIGPWDEGRFFLYSEETDYARRIREHGMLIRYVPAARVAHRAGGSGSSPQLDALLEVNKLRYFQKWHRPVPAGAFGLILLARNVVRPHRAGARAAVRALLSPSARAALPGGPR